MLCSATATRDARHQQRTMPRFRPTPKPQPGQRRDETEPSADQKRQLETVRPDASGRTAAAAATRMH